MDIFKSASKFVFVLLTLSACVGFFMKLLAPDQFMLLAVAASSFYFSNKGDASQPFAGK